MEVEFAFIAGAADVFNGLFYVVRGGADVHNIPPGITYPAGVGPMSFVVRLVGEPQEVGQRMVLDFNIVDADGRDTGVGGKGEISFQGHPLDRTRTNAALIHYRIGSVRITGPGVYLFQLFHEGRRLTQVPFWVIEGHPPAEGP